MSMRQQNLFDDIRVQAAVAPPLKWAGGKHRLLPHIQPQWAGHSHRRLVEPFCGGMAVTLGLMPTRALANDVSPHLMNFYRHLQRGLIINLPMGNDEALFYANRTRFNALVASGHRDTSEAASLFYYLNKTCFNGLCRFNNRGEFNVPFGKYATITYTYDFEPYKEALSHVELMAADFATVPLHADDFVYADPPYDGTFADYATGGFDWRDQLRTAEWLAKHPGPVVLSNLATDRIVKLYRDLNFDLQFLDAPRRISCTGDRTPVREMLATRNLEVVQ